MTNARARYLKLKSQKKIFFAFIAILIQDNFFYVTKVKFKIKIFRNHNSNCFARTTH